MAQQTAVQWLINELKSGKNLHFDMTDRGYIITEHDNILDRILKMEKMQIMNAYCQGNADAFGGPAKSVQQYYNETFANK